MDIVDRLNIIIDALNISQRKFAKNIGVSSSTINKILNRKAKILPHQIILIEQYYNIPKEWLEQGIGEWTPQGDNKFKLKNDIIRSLEVLNEKELGYVNDFLTLFKKYMDKGE